MHISLHLPGISLHPTMKLRHQRHNPRAAPAGMLAGPSRSSTDAEVAMAAVQRSLLAASVMRPEPRELHWKKLALSKPSLRTVRCSTSSNGSSRIAQGPREDTGEQAVSDFARIDTDRSSRTGFPEAVWTPGKTPQQVAGILEAMAQKQRVAMATRVDLAMNEQVSALLPGVVYHEAARILTYQSAESSDRGNNAASPNESSVVIVSAGTSDLPVAEEARVTAEVMGIAADLVVDVGVAGIHRVLNQVERIRRADVVIVVAGMDGALPSVVAGLVDAPVIAVPTSIGYGASLGGVAALLSMLNSCSPGLTVVNIDNGFGAALAAGRIARRVGLARQASRSEANTIDWAW